MNRHFKKYYFYFLARIFDYFGLYQKSVPCYAQTIRFRSFFWDSQTRYANAITKNPTKITLQIQGGIGDFLQHLPFILENKSVRYSVATHFKGAPAFFKSLNVKVERYYFYSSKEEYREIRDLLKQDERSYICPRALFFMASPFGKLKSLHHTKKKIIGIHPGASSLASYKTIPVEFIKILVGYLNQEGFKVILFGTKKELSKMQSLKNKDTTVASDASIINNLSCVEHCDFFIGSDSVFKTMASMLRKPTIVLHQNHKNNFRDRVFIRPYVKERMMHVYQYTNFNKREMKSALQFISDVMDLRLNSTKDAKN